MKKFEKKTTKPARYMSYKGSFKHGDKLDRRILEGTCVTNVIEWTDLWINEKLPKYGNRYPRQLRERTFIPITNELLPFTPLVLEEREAFIPNEAESE